MQTRLITYYSVEQIIVVGKKKKKNYHAPLLPLLVTYTVVLPVKRSYPLAFMPACLKHQASSPLFE